MSHPVDNIKKIIDITPEMEAGIRDMLTVKTFRRGDTIRGKHRFESLSFYISKGAARVFYTRMGREHTYSFAFDDEYITVPMSLIKMDDATITVEFLEKTDVIFLPLDDFRTIVRDFGQEHIAEVSSYIIATLFEHTRLIEERLLTLQSMSAPERYRWFTERYPAVVERATITQIASYLGVTKETLYRIRAGKYNPKNKQN